MASRTIAIAGCGPCGLAVALLLARAGERLVLFERFAEPRPIGSGLMIQPTGHAVLAQLGLIARIIREGARIDRLYGLAGDRVALSVDYDALGTGPRHFGIGIHRAALFAALHEAVLAESVEIRTGHSVTGSHLVGERRCLEFADGRTSEPFDLVIDAMGSGSALGKNDTGALDYGALWATLDWPDELAVPRNTLSQRYRQSSKMAGVLPLGRGGGSREQLAFFWSLKSEDFEQWRVAGLDAWKQEVTELWPECACLMAQIVDPDQVIFARYAHRTLARPVEEAMIHIGDAWHSASPQLGQGANMALLDAWALARALGRNARIPAALADAVAQRRRHVTVYQWLTWLATPVYQSDSRMLPYLRDRLVGPLTGLRPATKLQAKMVAGLVANPLAPLGLAKCE